MPKHLRGMICLLGAVLMLAGCKIDESSSSGQQQVAAVAPTQATAQAVDPNQPGEWVGPDIQTSGTLERLNQLAISSLYLQSTEHPITAEQAAVLLPLWQSLQSSMQPAGGANATPGAPSDATPGAPIDDTQLTPILDNIEAALTVEQKEILSGQTQEQLWAWAQEQGLMSAVFGGPQGDGTPGAGRGNGQGGPPGDGTPRAGRVGGLQGTPRADFTPPADFTPGARGNRGGFVFGSPLIDAVVEMLQGLTGQ